MGQWVEVKVPTEEEEGAHSTVSRWLKQLGEMVAQHEPLLELSTDKASVEIAAPVAGRLAEIVRPEGSEVDPGDLLARIEVGASAHSSNSPATLAGAMPARASAANRTEVDAGGEMLSPAVRKLLAENKLDAAQIKGSGRGGRITHQDVLDHLARRAASATESGPTPSRTIPHTPMRKLIAEHMVRSALQTAPHVTAVHECDLSAVLADRERRKRAAASELRLTLSAYFVKAASRALAQVPQVNSRFTEEALELFDGHQIGLATALGDEGLIVPVIRDVQNLDLLQIAAAIDDLGNRARTGKLKPKETQGGTFTITNHGMGGSLIATPIINQPQSAILGLGKLQKRAVVVESSAGDQVVIRPMVYVTLTIDHRALDGFVANRFLQVFCTELEQWAAESSALTEVSRKRGLQ